MQSWYHKLLPRGNQRAFHYCFGTLHQSARQDFHIRLQPNHALASAVSMGLAQEPQLVPTLLFSSHTPWYKYLDRCGLYTRRLPLNWPTILPWHPSEVLEHLERHPSPFFPWSYVESWSCWWLDYISCWDVIDHSQHRHRSGQYVTLLSNASNTWR